MLEVREAVAGDALGLAVRLTFQLLAGALLAITSSTTTILG